MQLGIFSLIKAIFGFGSSNTAINTTKDEDHTYIRGPMEGRGPCPGLNSLANQGFLYVLIPMHSFLPANNIYRPRDGKNITQAHLKAALEGALHMDSVLSTQLVNTVKPLLRKDGTFDLVDVRRHNVLEHDGSFTRYDIILGDNFTFQPAYFVSVLSNFVPFHRILTRNLATTGSSSERRQ
jgi:hypothetical protein